MKKEGSSNFIMGTVLFIMFVLGIKCLFVIEQVIPKYINCYQHLNIGMPSLTIFYFQSNYIIRHYPLHVVFFTSLFMFICILLAVFVKNKTIPFLFFTTISLILIFFISFFGRAMTLPLLKVNQLLKEDLEIHAIRLEIEKGNCPFTQFETMKGQDIKYNNQKKDDKKNTGNNSEIKLNQSNPISLLQETRQKELETKSWQILQKIAVAMETFRFAGEKLQYPASIIELTNAEPPFIEKKEIDAIKRYYEIQLIESGVDTYKVTASPTYEGEKIGLNLFIVNQTGIIRVVDNKSANK